jgi:hypothetical protein
MVKSIFDTLSSSIYPALLGQGIPKKIMSSVVGRLSKTGTDTPEVNRAVLRVWNHGSKTERSHF